MDEHLSPDAKDLVTLGPLPQPHHTTRPHLGLRPSSPTPNVSCPPQPCPLLSPGLQVRRMLKLDPSERVSIPEVFNHSWLRSRGPNSQLIPNTPTQPSTSIAAKDSSEVAAAGGGAAAAGDGGGGACAASPAEPVPISFSARAQQRAAIEDAPGDTTRTHGDAHLPSQAPRVRPLSLSTSNDASYLT